MRRAWAWMALGVMLAAAGPGAAAQPDAVDRLELLLDAVDRLDGEIESLTQQAAAAQVPADQDRLQTRLETLRQQRAGLTAQVEPLLPAFPQLQSRWNAQHTAERSGAIEEHVDQQLQRQEILLENSANARVRR